MPPAEPKRYSAAHRRRIARVAHSHKQLIPVIAGRSRTLLVEPHVTPRGSDLVLWYIAHISAVDRIAACGPWVKLEGYPASPAAHDHHH